MTRQKWFLLAVLFLVGAQAHARLDLTATSMASPGDRQMPYFYVFLTVENRTGNDLEFNLKFRTATMGGGAEFPLRDQTIGAGQRKSYHMALPMPSSSWCRVEYSDSTGDSGNINANSSEKSFLCISDLNARPTEAEMVDFTAAFKNPGIPSGSATSMARPIGRSYSSRRRSGDNLVECREIDSLPSDWRCYTIFRAVMIRESEFRRLSHPVKAALTSYVEMGGYLSIYNAERPSTESVMLGTEEYTGDAPIVSRSIQMEWRMPAPLWAGFQDNGGAAYSFPYNVQKTSGRVSGLILTSLFFLIAGPLNHYYFKRKNRIRMLMISLPAISMLFCLIAFVHFLAVQGFTKKGGTLSVTLLDEARVSGLTFSRHMLFSGLYPMRGFQFRNETAFYSLPSDMRSFGGGMHSGRYNDQGSFEMELGSSFFKLTSGLFKPSVDFHYFTAVPFKTKEKMLYDPEDSSIINGFEVPMRKLFLHDNDGFFTASNLEPGAKAELKVGEFAGQASSVTDYIDLLLRGNGELTREETDYIRDYLADFLAPSASDNSAVSYIAILDKPFDSAAAGVDITSGSGAHILAGILKTE